MKLNSIFCNFASNWCTQDEDVVGELLLHLLIVVCLVYHLPIKILTFSDHFFCFCRFINMVSVFLLASHSWLTLYSLFHRNLLVLRPHLFVFVLLLFVDCCFFIHFLLILSCFFLFQVLHGGKMERGRGYTTINIRGNEAAGKRIYDNQQCWL